MKRGGYLGSSAPKLIQIRDGEALSPYNGKAMSCTNPNALQNKVGLATSLSFVHIAQTSFGLAPSTGEKQCHAYYSPSYTKRTACKDSKNLPVI